MLKSKTSSFVILAITALGFSGGIFSFFNDPEGPNLLVVLVMTAVIYCVSLPVFLFKPFLSFTKPQRLVVVIVFQMILAFGIYFLLR